MIPNQIDAENRPLLTVGFSSLYQPHVSRKVDMILGPSSDQRRRLDPFSGCEVTFSGFRTADFFVVSPLN